MCLWKLCAWVCLYSISYEVVHKKRGKERVEEASKWVRTQEACACVSSSLRSTALLWFVFATSSATSCLQVNNGALTFSYTQESYTSTVHVQQRKRVMTLITLTRPHASTLENRSLQEGARIQKRCTIVRCATWSQNTQSHLRLCAALVHATPHRDREHLSCFVYLYCACDSEECRLVGAHKTVHFFGPCY